MPAPLVQVDGISKSYLEGGAETHVLRDVTFALESGATTSLVGASGSGKTTLLALVAGLMVPDAGSIRFDEQDVTTLDDRARARLRAQRIGIVLQNGNLIPFLTARENVELAVELAGGTPRRSGAADLLAELGLAKRINHLPRRLSGGEAQRVAVAVALANAPELLLADEVTGELDSESAEQVMHIIFEAWRARGLTVLFVTHNTDLAERAQHRLRLASGQVHRA
jgi:putative ABC transport system ATP-binding protein